MKYFLGIILFFIFQSSYAGIYKWTDKNGRVHFGDKPKEDSHFISLKQTGKSKTKTPSQKVIFNKNSNWLRLLERKSFDKLTYKLEKLQRTVDKNIKKDTPLINAYLAFKSKNPKHETLLNQWIKKSPKAYSPYLARAYFYYRKGWTARGHSYRSKTSDEAFSKMDVEFKKVLSDLDMVNKLTKHSLAAYYLHIRLFTTARSTKETELQKVKKAALLHYPASFEIRSALMQSLEPKWGGSLDEMAAFIKEAKPYTRDNPNLIKLSSTIPRILGNRLSDKKEQKLAIKFYDLAISYNKVEHFIFYRRAISKYFLVQYQNAFDDISEAINLDNTVAIYYKLRAKIALKQNNSRQAFTDRQFANKLDPLNKAKFNTLFNDIQKRVSVRNKTITKRKKENTLLDAKITKLNQSIAKNPNHPSLYYKRAKTYLMSNKIDSAFSDAKKAILLAPKTYLYYKLMDDILVYKRDWPKIIHCWKLYLKHKPKSAAAHFELFGTYHHNKDESKSLHHLKLAAKYGHNTAKNIYNKTYANQ